MDPKEYSIIRTYKSCMYPSRIVPHIDYTRYLTDRFYSTYTDKFRKAYKDYVDSLVYDNVNKSVKLSFSQSQKKEGTMPTEYTFSFKDFLFRSIFPQIKRVIFSDPATVVIWTDGTKTVVKCEHEDYDPEKGLAMCFSKKALGNKGSYYNTFKKYLEQYERQKDLEDFHQDLN